MDDIVRHFHQVMPFEDLETANEMEILKFPTTCLRETARALVFQGDFRVPTFPAEWATYAQK